MPARIIARDASTWYNTVTIDRGSAEMIEPDMPVITEEGLVGQDDHRLRAFVHRGADLG